MTKDEARKAIKEAYGNSEYTDEIIKTLETQCFESKTNGDIIQDMFPNAEIFIDTRGDYHYVYVTNKDGGSSWKIRKEWWDSPYKKDNK